jgi:hypothetical protein
LEFIWFEGSGVEKPGQPGQCPELFSIGPELTQKLGANCSEHCELKMEMKFDCLPRAFHNCPELRPKLGAFFPKVENTFPHPCLKVIKMDFIKHRFCVGLV